MKLSETRFRLIGSTMWLASIQYFVVQIIVANSWVNRYSWTKNTISDLGNTICGIYGKRVACSPLHSLMNYSFIVLGLTMILGSVFIYEKFSRTLASMIGFSFIVVSGVGTIIVGLFPENTINIVHVFGAALVFIIGNLSLIILSLTLKIPKALRIYTFISGAISLVALLFLITNHYLNIGIGGMERITDYPQVLWFIVFGLWLYYDTVKPQKLSRI